jgi:phosphatidylserine/phosphatidylglycerophosphate/cardiolipin synthase-like enzyme
LPEPFPTVGGNSIVPIERGADFFERMLAAVRGARATVDVEMYLWDDDDVGRQFVEALAAAASAGRRVRVLVDDNGARSVIPLLSAASDAGGDVRVFNPFRWRFLSRYFHRTHKKIVVCDGSLAFTGGAGFSRHWSSGRRRDESWHDYMFELRGPVVGQLVRLFECDLARWPEASGRARTEESAAAADEPHPEGNARLQVLRGWPDARDFRQSLIAAIDASKERVWLGSPYFIPPPNLIRALTGALKRGADVRLVLPSGNWAHPLLWHASRRHYQFFLRRGATIHEFAQGFYHAKLAVIDRDAAIVGSSNLDYWSWNRNAEIDLLATDAETVELVARCFDRDVARSREVTRRDVGMRSWWTKRKETIAGWIEKWL